MSEEPKLIFGVHILCPLCKGKGQRKKVLCGLCKGQKFITKEQDAKK